MTVCRARVESDHRSRSDWREREKLLFVAMPMKYIFDNPILAKYVGMGHGVLFILFLIVLFVVCEKQKWSLKMFILGLIASILPFGPFVFDAKIKKLEPEQAEA